MDTNAINGTIVVLLGTASCLVLVFFDKWLRQKGAKTRFIPTISGALVLASAVTVTVRIIDTLPSEDATLVTGVIVIAGISVLSTAIESAAIND